MITKIYDNLVLREPNISDKQKLIEFKNEFLNLNEQIYGGSGLEKYDYEQWLNKIAIYNNKNTCPSGRVPATQLITERLSDNKIIGVVNIRHYLEGNIALFIGHIGYSIAPSERGKGYAIKQLNLALEYCKSMGINKVLVCCNVNNIPSEKTIIKCGGKFDKVVEFENEKYNRYFICTNNI